jgi:hypothetical protein
MKDKRAADATAMVATWLSLRFNPKDTQSIMIA